MYTDVERPLQSCKLRKRLSSFGICSTSYINALMKNKKKCNKQRSIMSEKRIRQGFQ